MNPDLIKKLQKQRELAVKVGKFTFTAMRPTAVEALTLHRQSERQDEPVDYRMCQQFVVGWEGVLEDDVIGGGGQTPVEFSPELWAIWCADRTDFWGPISTAILGAYNAHTKRMENVTKN